ncbi:smad nuclear-interacting protein 1 [Microtus ochrogaster]|uniref:Smad nuclear-interacting protein 1 n=1 Tax=Microtus ochrogaster TaxID=79684 RepID=A0ABM0KUZ4_MICOH|nr:smad nuclear-interacting protein 1 [Microtus ochrogaster]
MKEGKSERERSGRRRHRADDALATVVVKQGRLSPEPVAHRRPDAPAANPSPPAAEPSGHRGSRGRGASRSPAKKKNKSSGRRSKSPRTKRSRSPHYNSVKVKQEREDHPRRGREDRQHREPSEQEQRRTRNSERDWHRGHSRQRRSSGERPVRGQGRDRDSQILQAQEEERDFHNARRREHRQQNEGASSEAQEAIPRPAGNRSKEVPVKEKPSFELSGALLEDTNTFRGVVIKYSEPPEARIPKKRWRLYPFKNDEVLPVMYLHRQSAYLLGRHRRIADIPIDHPSCSKQHAVFQYRLVEYTRADGTVGRRVKPYIIDLGSGNGTFLNNKRIEPQRYYELKEKDVLKFGFSSREYVLLHESSDTSELDRKEDEDDEEEEMVSDS